MNSENRSLNNSHTCETLYVGKIYLQEDQRFILVACNVVAMVLNVLANAAVIYSLITRKLLKKVSMKLLFYLSLIDLNIAVFTQPLFILMLMRYSTNQNCLFDMIAQFWIAATKHMSAYTIGLIAFDRYCKMKYLNRYPELMRSWKFRLSIVLVILLSFVHGLLLDAGTYWDMFRPLYIASTIMDAALFMMIFMVYLQTIRTVKTHRRYSINKSLLTNVDSVITSMVTRILLAGVVCYIPYMIMSVIEPLFSNTTDRQTFVTINFLLFLSYDLIFINSSLHAVIFLTLHRKRTKDYKAVFSRPVSDIRLTFVKMKSITFGDNAS